MGADAILSWKGPPSAGYGIWVKKGMKYEFHSRVTEPKCVLEQLSPDSVISIRVAREVGPSLYSEWSEVSVSGKHNVDVEMGTIKEKEAMVRFANDAMHSHDIFIKQNYSIWPGPNGAIKNVGKGREAYENLRWAPSHGYEQNRVRVDSGDVFVVRTPDGRYAKLFCHKNHAEYQFLSKGGTYFGGGPIISSTLLAENTIKIECGDKLKQGETFLVYKIFDDDGIKLTAQTTESFLIDKDMHRGERIRYCVTKRSDSGAESAPSYTTIDNLPSHWKRQTVTLDAMNNDPFSFESNITMKRADEYDMIIVNSAGGATSLGIAVPYGAIQAKAEKVNDLLAMNHGALERRLSTTHINTDDREPQSQTFLVRTSRMNFVYVTIVSTAHPKVTFDYIILRRTVNEIVTELKTHYVKGTIDDIKSVNNFIKDLANDDFDIRSNAQKSLIVHGSKALDELFEAHESAPIDVKIKIAQIVEEIWSRWKVTNNKKMFLNAPKDNGPAGNGANGMGEF